MGHIATIASASLLVFIMLCYLLLCLCTPNGESVTVTKNNNIMFMYVVSITASNDASCNNQTSNCQPEVTSNKVQSFYNYL